MRLCIFGAGGSGREVFYLAQDCGFYDIAFIDLYEGELYGSPIELESSFDPDNDPAVVAIGNPELRKQIVDKIIAKHPHTHFTKLIHPTVLKDDVRIGMGAVISANCVLTCEIEIGDFCQLNIATTISHEVKAGDYLTTAPGVHITGNNTIGHNVFFGSNVSTRDKVTICDDVKIGAGACVVGDITEPGTYIGVPAKKVV